MAPPPVAPPTQPVPTAPPAHPADGDQGVGGHSGGMRRRLDLEAAGGLYGVAFPLAG
ncbi:hypothetical protein [Streptomyces albidoflavus]|uniref:hypothetical protein n=1 Tax=Streptomyces albidoflavus TaxID=1886 RepID=UPI003D14618A